MQRLRVLDLFSGIGGFSLGLERAGGFETVAFCEIDPFCRKVLAKHWPDVPIFDDVRTLTSDHLDTIDVICGGFPCQDLSVAGTRAGIDAERSGLWSEIARLTRELRPQFIIVENVANLLSGPTKKRGGWFGRVLSDLASVGFDAEWHCIPSSFLGAWHKRDRVWILAYPYGQFTQGGGTEPILRQSDLQRQLTRSFERWPGLSHLPAPTLCGAYDGVRNRVDRIRGGGNAVCPPVVEMIGRSILASTMQVGNLLHAK